MAERPSYVELHVHSCFSFLDGASTPEELVEQALQLGYEALALTDHDGVYGSMAFARYARSRGLFPITGAEVTLADGTHLTLLAETRQGYGNLCRILTRAHLDHADLLRTREDPREGTGREDPREGEESGAAGREPAGPRKSGTAGKEPEGPRVEVDVLFQHAAGLICLTGCRQGRLARLVDAGETKAAMQWLHQLKEAFGPEHVFVELQHNLVYGDTARVRQLAELASRAGLAVVATNDVHYHCRERHRLQDVLVAIRHRTTLDESHRWRRPNSEFYLKSPREMAAIFADLPQALQNTVVIAERCRQFDLTQDLGYTFPDFVSKVRMAGSGPGPSPAQGAAQGSGEAGDVASANTVSVDGVSTNTASADTVSADAELARVCWQALQERYPAEQAELRAAAEERLKEELRLISRHRLSGFFLVYRDLLELAKEVAAEVRRGKTPGRLRLPPGRGRGSSVSSIVCYLIGLSHVDPVRCGLFLGRFLNDELQTVPDIDLDFPRDIRERLIERVYERYGRDHAALVCSLITYRLRSALRDIGRALGIPLAWIDRLSRLSEGGRAASARQELARIPELASRLDEPPWCHLIEMAEQIDGFPRHIGQHVGGMVISSQPLVEMVPVEPGGIPGRTVCQWDKDSCEDAGFIKVDFLALGALGQVEECLDLIAEGRGENVDLSTIDYDDPEVYRMIQEGDVVGVFQIESRAQMQMLPRTRPQNLEDLAVQVAIVRPGPIVGGAVNPYVRRRERLRRDPSYKPPFDHPLLERALGETLGVILYQDQVLQVCQDMAGFSAGQADGLRRAMSRRRSELVMEKYWPDFRDGAARRGVPEETARRVFEKIMAFSEFGFPKSHAAAFAVLAYQSAWLRRYYLPEFTAALFNNQPMGFYPLDVIVKDAQRHGLEIRPPCINRSQVLCTVEDGAVRLGLGFVQQVGRDAAAIVAEREARGPYRSLSDLVRRVSVSRQALENLIRVGAMDVFGLGERRLLWQLGLLMPGEGEGSTGRSRLGTRARGNGQASGEGGRLMRQLPLPLGLEAYEVQLPDPTDWERMVADYGLMHLSTRYHPVGLLRERLDPRLRTVAGLEHARDGERVAVAGLVVARQRPGTAKGFVFLLLEDETGLINVVVRPDLYERHRDLVRTDPLVEVDGRLQKRDGIVNLLAEHIAPLRLRGDKGISSLAGRRRGRRSPATAASTLGRAAAAAQGAAVFNGAPMLDEFFGPRPIEMVDQARLVAPPAHNFY